MPRSIVPVAKLLGYPRRKNMIVKMQAKPHSDEGMDTFTDADRPDMETRESIKGIPCMASFRRFRSMRPV